MGRTWGAKAGMPAGGKFLGYKSDHTCGQEGLGVQRLVHLQAGRAWGTEVNTPAGGKDLGCRVGAPVGSKEASSTNCILFSLPKIL